MVLQDPPELHETRSGLKKKTENIEEGEGVLPA
jgi:hypothetical protein